MDNVAIQTPHFNEQALSVDVCVYSRTSFVCFWKKKKAWEETYYPECKRTLQIY